MFNDAFQLTQAVLDGRKTQTRRIITCPIKFKGEWVAGFHVYRRHSDNAILEYPCMYDADERDFDGGYISPRYKVGEVVAVAQSYESLFHSKHSPDDFLLDHSNMNPKYCGAGFKNKMFVKSELMPNRIRITDVRVERLNDISEDDCFKEGIYASNSHEIGYGIPWVYGFDKCKEVYFTPREAYAALIDKIAGKGTFESNPYVFVYEFELVK